MSDKELINDMIVPLLHQWTKANALFKPPVINQCRTIELKLTKLWHKAVETSLGKGNLARKNEFLHTLDTLFDILTCKCSIQLCSESNCSHSGKRENNSHIDCGCPREKKIPVLELEFIKAQRTKAEGQGSMQMGSIDYSETKKQIANAKKREQIREREQKKKMKSEEAIQREEELCQDVYHFFDSSSDEQEATSDDIPPINVNATKLSELVDLSLEVLEPPLTTSLTSQELRNLKETPMQVPKWPSHTQSVERCVKMVTEAAGHVYSHERREGDGGGTYLMVLGDGGGTYLMVPGDGGGTYLMVPGDGGDTYFMVPGDGGDTYFMVPGDGGDTYLMVPGDGGDTYFMVPGDGGGTYFMVPGDGGDTYFMVPGDGGDTYFMVPGDGGGTYFMVPGDGGDTYFMVPGDGGDTYFVVPGDGGGTYFMVPGDGGDTYFMVPGDGGDTYFMVP
ncbi:surface-exposed virulence protein BigA-like 2, partial [Homarus americanus]